MFTACDLTRRKVRLLHKINDEMLHVAMANIPAQDRHELAAAANLCVQTLLKNAVPFVPRLEVLAGCRIHEAVRRPMVSELSMWKLTAVTNVMLQLAAQMPLAEEMVDVMHAPGNGGG